MTGAEWALVIRRGIAERAERAFFGGLRRLGVPVAAGDGCRKRASGVCSGAFGVGSAAGCLKIRTAAGGPDVARDRRRGVVALCVGLPSAGPVGGCGCLHWGRARWTCGRGCMVMGAGQVGGMKKPALRRGVVGGISIRGGACPAPTACRAWPGGRRRRRRKSLVGRRHNLRWRGSLRGCRRPSDLRRRQSRC